MDELLKIFANTTDASFAVDRHQRILMWNSAAEQLLGVPADKALGRPCWQILQGQSLSERPFCGPHCPVLQSLQQNRPVPAFDMLITNAAQQTIRTSISTLFVPPDLQCQAVIIHLQRNLDDPFHWPDSF